MPEYIYLSPFDNNGRPTEGIVQQALKPGVLQEISSNLPSRRSVTTSNPQWIKRSDLHINTSVSDVYMTFLADGAGHRNAFGYYTYPTDKPPLRCSDIETIFVAFPNFSVTGGGGTMNAGDSVQLVYKAKTTTSTEQGLVVETSNTVFPAGISIGFVLFQNGWKGGEVLLNHRMITSTSPLNPEPTSKDREHFVNYLSSVDRSMVVYGVEDLRRNRSRCDHDFNDAVFGVTMTSVSGIAPESINDATLNHTRGTVFCDDIHEERKGHDFDYNDLVLEYRCIESLAPNGDIKSIDLKMIGKHRGASYDHAFGIVIPSIKRMARTKIVREIYVPETDTTTCEDITTQVIGTGSDRITIIPSTKQFMPSNGLFTNTVIGENLQAASYARVKIFFDVAVPRSAIIGDVAPYRVFLNVFPSGTVGVGSSSSYYTYSGYLYNHQNHPTQYQNIPKIFVVQGLRDWLPPVERRQLFHAYPRAKNYLLSNGASDTEWHNPKNRVDSRCCEYVGYEDTHEFTSVFDEDVTEIDHDQTFYYYNNR
jgi:LruC domain-containing protein